MSHYIDLVEGGVVSDPAEAAAVDAALDWARDHGSATRYPNAEALLAQAMSQYDPAWDPNLHLSEDPSSGLAYAERFGRRLFTLKAHLHEHFAETFGDVYVLALAPPVPPLSPGAWRAGLVDAREPGNGIFLLITGEPDQLERLHGGAK
jgi:hypothetical protein